MAYGLEQLGGPPGKSLRGPLEIVHLDSHPGPGVTVAPRTRNSSSSPIDQQPLSRLVCNGWFGQTEVTHSHPPSHPLSSQSPTPTPVTHPLSSQSPTQSPTPSHPSQSPTQSPRLGRWRVLWLATVPAGSVYFYVQRTGQGGREVIGASHRDTILPLSRPVSCPCGALSEQLQSVDR